MAMNWPQLVKPCACRSALCSLTLVRNPRARTASTPARKCCYFVHRLSLLRLNWFFPNPIQRIRGSTSHRQRRPPLRSAVIPLIWTAVSYINKSFLDHHVRVDYSNEAGGKRPMIAYIVEVPTPSLVRLL